MVKELPSISRHRLFRDGPLLVYRQHETFSLDDAKSSTVVYSQVIKGAEYMTIAAELEEHAGEELQHALMIARQIDYLGGKPSVEAKRVRTSNTAARRSKPWWKPRYGASAPSYSPPWRRCWR